jgi:hypothetical protein
MSSRELACRGVRYHVRRCGAVWIVTDRSGTPLVTVSQRIDALRLTCLLRGAYYEGVYDGAMRAGAVYRGRRSR